MIATPEALICVCGEASLSDIERYYFDSRILNKFLGVCPPCFATHSFSDNTQFQEIP